MIQYRNAGEVLKRIVRGIIRPRPLVKYWEWADKHVTIPPDASGPIPGRLNTGRLPIFRGLFDLAQQSHIHFVTLCASIRVGKTLFSIVLMLYWLAEKAGSIVWLDPSGASAKKVSKAEIDPFILACEPAAKLAVFGRTTWTSLWKTFRGKILRFVGSGEEANLHGFNAELAIIPSRDSASLLFAMPALLAGREGKRRDVPAAGQVAGRMERRKPRSASDRMATAFILAQDGAGAV